MNSQIRQLDNETLLRKTKSLAEAERQATLAVLHHLHEINRRRLFAARGCGSLFEFVTRELGYSDASAQRRIMAMRLLVEIPEVEQKIQTGELTLSNVAQAQKHFQTERKLGNALGKDQKRKILNKLTHQSSREAEKQLLALSSSPITSQKPDKIQPVTPTHFLRRQQKPQDLNLRTSEG